MGRKHAARAPSPLFDAQMNLQKACAEITRLESEAKDARYLVAALIKAAGGRVELTMDTVMSIGPKDQITHWDDPFSGRKVYMLTEMTQCDAASKQGDT